MKKIIFAFLLFILLGLANTSLAAPTPNLLDTGKLDIGNQTNAFRAETGYNSDTKVESVLATVIKAFLGLVGIIFLILIIIAGFNYLTAAGDEAKVEKALNTIQRAIIGLIIIVSAYAITAFVFSKLPGSSGGGPQIGPIN